MNWILAVEWCIEKNLTQQAITQLQEGLITQVCKLQNLNIQKFEDREIAKNIIRNASQFSPPFICEIRNPFRKLSDLRNDINHAGYRSNPKDVNTIRVEVSDNFSIIKASIEKHNII